MYAYVYNMTMNTTFAKVPKIISISEFRAALAANLAKAKKAPLIILDRRGGESYVVLSLEMYNELVEVWAKGIHRAALCKHKPTTFEE